MRHFTHSPILFLWPQKCVKFSVGEKTAKPNLTYFCSYKSMMGEYVKYFMSLSRFQFAILQFLIYVAHYEMINSAC